MDLSWRGSRIEGGVREPMIYITKRTQKPLHPLFNPLNLRVHSQHLAVAWPFKARTCERTSAMRMSYALGPRCGCKVRVLGSGLMASPSFSAYGFWGLGTECFGA